jgi:hypothetical protein
VCIYFFGQLITLPRSMPDIHSISALICRTRSTPPSPFKKGSAVSALSCSRNYDLCSIAMRVFRSELPGAGERQNLKSLPRQVAKLTSTRFWERLISLPFQMPLHPMNRFAHKHAKVGKTYAATKPGRHGRARSPGEGKCCDDRKGLLSVPAIMPCAEL